MPECCDHKCNEGRQCPHRYGTPTVRTYPRSMAQAFPDMRHQWLYAPTPTLAQRLLRWLRDWL